MIKAADLQLTLFAPEEHPLVSELTKLDLNGLTPMAALRWLESQQAKLTSKH
jgi:hypothetical protein